MKKLNIPDELKGKSLLAIYSNDDEIVKINYENGYEVSIVKELYLDNKQEQLYEVAILKDGEFVFSELTYTCGILSYINEQDVIKVLEKVKNGKIDEYADIECKLL